MIEIVRDDRHAIPPCPPRPRGGYAELCATSNFTFLTGASHPEELVTRAAELGLAAIAITDRNSLAGVVRAYRALQILREQVEDRIRIASQHRKDNCSRQEIGAPDDIARPPVSHLPKLIAGCRLVLRDSAVEWIVLPTDKPAWQRLTRLLTLGKRRAGKGECHLDLIDLLEGCPGMILIALPDNLSRAASEIRQVQHRYPDHVFTGAAPRYDGGDRDWLNRCAMLARRTSAPMVAVGDVLMHRANRRQLADVLTCMRLGCTIDQIGRNALPNAERRLKAATEMDRMFADHPDAVHRTVGAGYTAEEADKLRRALASFRRMGTIGEHRDTFIAGMMANGYNAEVAARCFSQIEGFADYGFPESHAAAFALLVYVSAWLKRHYPAIFACALLNSQPMGFYAPAQIVRDAREHQVEVRPICVNHSDWDNTLERRPDGALALRLGFRQIKGFREEDAAWIVAARGNGYQGPETVWLRAGLAPAVLERLAEADGFAGIGLSRRDALWQVRAIRAPAPLPLFNDPIDGEVINEPAVSLPRMQLGEEVVEDYVATRLTLRAHPMTLLRRSMPGLTRHDMLPEAPLQRTSVCGLVITRQRPGTASGVVFVTLEDETGVSNVIVWRKIFEANRRAVMGGRLLRVTGMLQREGIVTHLIAHKIEDVSHRLSDLGHPMDDVIGQTTAKTDSAPRPLPAPRAMHPRDQARHLFPSRDFH